MADQTENGVGEGERRAATPNNAPLSGTANQSQASGPIAAQLQRDLESVRQFLEVQEEKEKWAAEAELQKT